MDMTKATDISVALVSVLGIRKAMTHEVSAYNELTCVNDGTVSAGKYSIEITCKDAEGRSYRMCSPEPILEISPTTAVSDAALSKIQVTGDVWELTADVEMHEAAARTYMSLLEEARQKAEKAATDAEAASKDASEASKTATQVAQEASTAVSNANAAASSANDAAGKANAAAERIDSIAVTLTTRFCSERRVISLRPRNVLTG